MTIKMNNNKNNFGNNSNKKVNPIIIKMANANKNTTTSPADGK